MSRVKLSQQYIMINQYFGRKLKESRMQHVPPLSQEKVANDLGIPRSSFCNYELGQTSPPWWLVCVISKYFGKKLEYYSYFERGEDNIENFT